MKKRIQLVTLTLAFTLALALAPVQNTLPHASAMCESHLAGTISAGYNYSYAIKQDGSLWGWGNNAFGNLGDGTKTERRSPIKIMDGAVSVFTLRGEQLGYSSMVIKTDGSLWAWGNDAFIAHNLASSETTYLTPVKIMDDVTSVSAGLTHILVLKNDKSLWTWGRNEFGQLGDGTTADRTKLVKVLDDVAFISAGAFFNMAVKTDGSLWMWGRNEFYGTLGDETVVNRLTPFKLMDGVASVSAGRDFALALKTDGSLWGWGANRSNELGRSNTDGSTVGKEVPNPTPLKIMDGVTTISAGYHHGAAIKTDGSLWTWGENVEGQIGNGRAFQDYALPAKVMDDVAFVSTGAYHTMAIKTDGSLWAWGQNSAGQIGNDASWYPVATPEKIMDDVMIPGGTAPPHAQTPKPTPAPAPLPADDIRVMLDGRSLAFDVPPQIINGRTMVPLRAIFEALGASVDWNSSTQTVTATKDNTVVALSIGSTNPTVNGRVEIIDQPAVVIGGRTLAPLRFVAEAFGGTVKWDAAAKTAAITS